MKGWHIYQKDRYSQHPCLCEQFVNSQLLLLKIKVILHIYIEGVRTPFNNMSALNDQSSLLCTHIQDYPIFRMIRKEVNSMKIVKALTVFILIALENDD